jgi:ketosteroid isomerase-like protein
MCYYQVWTVRGGSVIRIESIREQQDALEAVGLGDKAGMSHEGVEQLRWLYGQWAKGNLWALRDVADPDMEWEWSEGLASLSGGPRVYRGLEEIGEATLEWLAAWDSYWMTGEEFIPAGDKVVVRMTVHARAANTDRVLEQRMAAVWTLRDGRAIRARYYDEPSQAFEAVGLCE